MIVEHFSVMIVEHFELFQPNSFSVNYFEILSIKNVLAF